jgi:hypothetical protein
MTQGIQEQLNKVMHSLKEAHHWIDDFEQYRDQPAGDMFLATAKLHVSDAIEGLSKLGQDILHNDLTPVFAQQQTDMALYGGYGMAKFEGVL